MLRQSIQTPEFCQNDVRQKPLQGSSQPQKHPSTCYDLTEHHEPSAYRKILSLCSAYCYHVECRTMQRERLFVQSLEMQYIHNTPTSVGFRSYEFDA
jgi:hypothetical protein